MGALATVAEWEALLDTVWASLVAGVGVTFVFSLAIYGAARAAEFRRDDRRLEASLAVALMLAGFAASAAAIIYGVVIMAQKS
jgi:hypothetical protein